MSHSIILAINVDAPPARVFEILTTTEGQQAFWTADCEVTADHARFGFAEAPVDLEVGVHTKANSLVRMKVQSGFPFWEGSTWEWELSPNAHSENSTTVIFRHYDFAEGIAENDLGGTAQTWAMTLQHLANFVTTGFPQPYFAAA
jgi:uncharacterized protein YndB with AHSA1/START domain